MSLSQKLFEFAREAGIKVVGQEGVWKGSERLDICEEDVNVARQALLDLLTGREVHGSP